MVLCALLYILFIDIAAVHAALFFLSAWLVMLSYVHTSTLLAHCRSTLCMPRYSAVSR